jgi:hypothetical protein
MLTNAGAALVSGRDIAFIVALPLTDIKRKDLLER